MFMKLFYIILFLCLVLVAIPLGSENSAQATLDLVIFSLPEMSLFMLVFGALGLGILIGLIPSIISVPMLKIKMKTMHNRIRELETNAVD